MNKFNLTFNGEILTGKDPDQVKLRFAEMFAIDDSEQLERFFSGQTIILRRDLERKAAAKFFHELHLLGAVAALVKVTDTDGADTTINKPAPPRKDTATAKKSTVASDPSAAKQTTNRSEADSAEQIWAVSSRVTKQKTKSKKTRQSVGDKSNKTPGKEKWNEPDIAGQLWGQKEYPRRQAEEEAAREKVEQAEARRKTAEDSARWEAERKQQLEIEKKQQLLAAAAKEAQIQQTESETKQRREAEEAVRLKAEREKKERRKAEKTAKLKAEQEEKQRKEAEKIAKLKAEQEEKQRKEAEKTAKLRAEQEKKQRKEAEQAAKLKAEQEEKQRKEAEKTAKLRAEQEEKQRKEAEKTAKLKAEQEKKQRKEAEKTAKLRAEQEKKQRKEAEQAAKLKAEQEEKQRKEAEKTAKLRAEQEKKQRKEAEKTAKLKAEQEKKQRKEAEQAAKLTAEQEALKREERQEASKLQAELEEIARLEAEETKRIRAEASSRRIEAERKSAERLQGDIEPPTPLKPQSALQTLLKPARAKTRVKTSLETPRGLKSQAGKASTTIQKARQLGAPNVYTLRPFRHTEEVRNRVELASQSKRYSYVLAVIALVAALITGGLFHQQTPRPTILGASAIAVDNQSGPLIVAGDSLLFHDRAGISTEVVTLDALGLSSLRAPLAFDSTDALLLSGRLLEDTADKTKNKTFQLLRCDLQQSECQLFSPELTGRPVSAFVINPIDNSVILADNQFLVKLDKDGVVISEAAATLPNRPVLRLHAGLLFVNSAAGSGISVYRYEDSAFGKQLDEILLLPPVALEAEQTEVVDFLFSGDAWWASLRNPESGAMRVYRFDDEWNNLGEVTMSVKTSPIQFTSWAEKTLVNDFRNATIQRFNAEGHIETPFASSQLADLINGQQRRAALATIAWRSALLLSTLVAVLGFGMGYLQGLRQLVYKPRRERGAEPLDEYADTVQWIDPIPGRQALMRHRTISYSLLIVAALLLAVANSVTAWQLAALLVALSGPLIALLLLGRHPIGHIGVLQERLLLVDHSGMYHLAGGSSVQYRGPFLLIDDVVVFSGNRLLPAFSPSQIQKQVRPLANSGVKVDRRTMLVKLLQSRHPLALGTLAILATCLSAAMLLWLQRIF